MSQSNRPMIPNLLVCVLVLMCSATFALAQAPNKDDYPNIAVFAGYCALGENKTLTFGSLQSGGGYASIAGFETSLTRNFTRHIGVKADFSAHFSTKHPVIICNPTCTTAPQETE